MSDTFWTHIDATYLCVVIINAQMKNFKNIAAALVLLLAGALNVMQAQNASVAEGAVYVEESYFANLHFRLDKTNLDQTYLTNPEILDSLSMMIDSIGRENINMIEVVSNASPEGVLEHNIWLAESRGKEIERFICQTYPELCGIMTVTPSGESWDELRELVVADTKLSEATKDKILAVIDADINVGTKKWRMQNVLGSDPAVGNVYNYLIKNIYKVIRNTGIKIHYNALSLNTDTNSVVNVEVADTVMIPETDVNTDTIAVADTITVADTIVETDTVQEEINEVNDEIKLREPMLSIKTNLLYDAVVIPDHGFKPASNVEVEYYFRNSNWSALAEFDSPWYSEEPGHFYFQLQNWQLEGRRYLNLGKNSVPYSHNGLYVSAYAMYNQYDLCFNAEGNGKQGEGAGAGLGIGYVKPISKNGKWKLEFSLKAGYYESHYDPYHYGEKNNGKYYYDWNGNESDFIRRNWRFRWVGPTSVGISLSYDILSRKVK